MGGSRNSRCVDCADAAAAVLARHLSPGQDLTVALSGGIDSVVLLDVLCRLQGRLDFTLRAVHVDHGISPLSQQWAAFCGALCARRDIPLLVTAVTVARDSGRGLEAAARDARYQAFSALDTDWIVLAHQQDDQVETLLANLLRGAGPHGAAGMPEVRSFEMYGGARRPRLLRPLLGVMRGEIEAYARDRALSWVQDASNADTGFARNFLRHEVVPLLARRFPGCRRTLARSAEWSAEAAQLLDALAQIDAGGAIDTTGRLSIEAMTLLDEARARNLLRYWLRSQGMTMPGAAMLCELRRQLATVKHDNRLRVVVGERAIRCHRGWACVEPAQSPAVPECAKWNGQASMPWGDGKVVFRQTTGEGIAEPLLRRGTATLRARSGGERMRLHATGPHRSLKNLLQEADIPPWQRVSMPLLWCGADLAWVPGIGVAAEFRCAPGEAGLLPDWEPG